MFSQTIFDLADYLVSNILLLLGVFCISLFVPYKIPKNKLLEELSIGTKYGKQWFVVWFFLIRYIVPVTVLVVFLDVIGII